MTGVRYDTVLFILFINFLTIIATHGTVDTSFPQLPVPVPVSPDHVVWNSKALHSIPPINNWFNNFKNEDAISDTCKDHLRDYSFALGNLTPWALQMFDASTKMPESVASGAYTHLGNFDQCLAVRADAFNGQYCGSDITLTNDPLFNLKLRIASCIPSTCSAEDLQALLEMILVPSLSLVNTDVVVSVNPINCYIEGDKPALSAASWVVISIIILLVVAASLSAVLDILETKSGSENIDSVVKSFSLTRNLKTMMHSEHARGSIQCMHGIRVVSLYWIMIGHRYGTERDVPKINMPAINNFYDDYMMQLILNAMPAVDTFFVMSGLLACYLLMKDLSRGIKFNPTIYYVHRYIRLTTTYALVIAFYATLYGDIGYGPLWRSASTLVTDRCKDAWWTGLLYVDNYVNFERYADMNVVSACVGQGWYLACDMHFAWLAPLVLLPLFYWPKPGKIWLLFLILASCFAQFTSAYINKYQMYNNAFDSLDRRFEFLSQFYLVSYMRATPYLVGICIGYFMFKKPKAIKMPKWMVICGWASSTVIALAVIFGPTIMYQEGYVYDRVGSAFYNGFHRVAWSAVIFWTIVACHYGYGGPVNSILSWTGWLPLSKISYCMFLVHIFIINQDTLQIKALFNFSHFSAFQRFFGDIIYSTMLSAILYTLVESPTLGLLKTFLKKSSPPPKKPETSTPVTSP